MIKYPCEQKKYMYYDIIVNLYTFAYKRAIKKNEYYHIDDNCAASISYIKDTVYDVSIRLATIPVMKDTDVYHRH